MSKGAATRSAILEVAASQARSAGLRGLTIGSLASATELSKSGLFAHFRSKEALQLAVLSAERDRFVELVVRPALRASRGEPRLRELVDRWLAWASQPGGCLFFAATAEFDDVPGPVRELLAHDERDWLDTIAQVVRGAVAEGHVTADLDVDQLAVEVHGVLLAFHHAHRLLQDPSAEVRARGTVAALLDRAQPD